MRALRLLLLSTVACGLGAAFFNGVDVVKIGPDGSPLTDPAGNQVIEHLAGLDALTYSLNTTIIPDISGEFTCLGMQKIG